MADGKVPCPLALSLTRVPVRRWATKADLAHALEVARQELDAHPQASRLATLAAEVGLSPFHLQRLFQARYGESPRAYAERVRVLRAWSYLASGMSVIEAAIEADFDTPQQLARVFRRVLDIAPSQVAKLVQPGE